jgi:hypothetical protein
MLPFVSSIYLDKLLSLNFLVFESITAIPATFHLDKSAVLFGYEYFSTASTKETED